MLPIPPIIQSYIMSSWFLAGPWFKMPFCREINNTFKVIYGTRQRIRKIPMLQISFHQNNFIHYSKRNCCCTHLLLFSEHGWIINEGKEDFLIFPLTHGRKENQAEPSRLKVLFVVPNPKKANLYYVNGGLHLQLGFFITIHISTAILLY